VREKLAQSDNQYRWTVMTSNVRTSTVGVQTTIAP